MGILIVMLIDWNKLYVPLGIPRKQVQTHLVDIVQEHCLSQIIDIPTRQGRTLYIILTNNATPVTRVKSMPPIGRVDHDTVLVEYDGPVCSKQTGFGFSDLYML